MIKHRYITEEQHPATLLICVDAPYNKTKDKQGYFDEFLSLVETNGSPYEEAVSIRLRTIDPRYFLTKGKVQEIKQLCEELKIEKIIISEPLSGQQLRNLEDFLNCIITDRTSLILEIFEKAATSTEGKTQVAIAKLEHIKTRLSGKGYDMAQQTGAIGVRSGMGETIKEKEKRFIEETILKYRRKLAEVAKTRDLQRKQRLSNKIPHICLIGYTNAGKSTLLNTLTKSNVLAEDKLFATLDTTTRELYVDGTKKGVISDTVGFIQQLPHTLIDAFKSTLSELQYADLLLLVIDASDPNWQDHTAIVHTILDELGVKKDILYVFNKIDKIDNIEAFERTIYRHEPNVLISAHSKEGVEELLEFLSEWKKK